jgi:hypothetical protein
VDILAEVWTGGWVGMYGAHSDEGPPKVFSFNAPYPAGPRHINSSNLFARPRRNYTDLKNFGTAGESLFDNCALCCPITISKF